MNPALRNTLHNWRLCTNSTLDGLSLESVTKTLFSLSKTKEHLLQTNYLVLWDFIWGVRTCGTFT